MSDLRKGGICPACEKGKLRVIQKDVIFTYKAKTKTFEDEKVYQCDLCDYEALSQKDNLRIERILTDFRRCIDGLLTCEQLRRIRTSLDLNKKKMAKLLSVNEKTIGRYENGKITQSERINKLYKILALFPATARILDSDRTVFEVGAVQTVVYKPNIRAKYYFNVDFAADDYNQFKGTTHASAA